jgi:hypothetical protein
LSSRADWAHFSALRVLCWAFIVLGAFATATSVLVGGIHPPPIRAFVGAAVQAAVHMLRVPVDTPRTA